MWTETNRSPFLANQAISLTLINEYTDWSAGGGEQNFIDSLTDILGDALVVAPLTNAVNLHLKLAGQKSRSTTNNNVYSYVFVYQVSWVIRLAIRLGKTFGNFSFYVPYNATECIVVGVCTD